LTRKSAFLTFILSWLPGLGHLYLGLNKRGLQFMTAFFACIILIPLLPFVFPFVLAILWFYSLFDALQKAAVINTLASHQGTPTIPADPGDAAIDRDSLTTNLDQTIDPLRALREQNTVNPLWIGGVCILVGLLVMVREVFPTVWDVLVRMHIGSILLAAVLIGFGLWLIRTYSKKE
jgi:hypothetical protein